MNEVRQQDIEQFVSSFQCAEKIANHSFLITGGTGLIGSSLILALLALEKAIRIIAPIRNKKKAESVLGEKFPLVEWIECDLESCNYDSLGHVDYIIHCAAPTSSQFFIEKPVETIDSIMRSTRALLEYARKQRINSFVYLSSLEVYGSGLSFSKITEDMQGYWNPQNIRSSYPIAKRCAENLCVAYAFEYTVPVRIARLTQTTGAGIDKNDNRIIVQFVRCAVNGEDIILQSTGESARPYCYTIDSILAILQILLYGENGMVYNVANEETYISAYDLAVFIRDHINPKISVRVVLNDNQKYPPTSKLFLSTERLRSLGWYPQYDLRAICCRLAKFMKDAQ